MSAPRPTAGFIAANTVLLWLATAVAAAALWPIYRTPQIVLLVAVATAAASLIAIAGAVFRLAAPIVLIATVAVFLLLGVPLAVPAKATAGVLPTLDGLRDLVAGVALGWKQLLTISLPVGDYQALLVPSFVLVLLLTVLSLSIALRSRFGDLAVLGPVGLFLAALFFGPAVTPSPFGLPLALFAITLVWLAWRRWYRRHTTIHRLADSLASTMTRRDSRYLGFRTALAAVVILGVAGGAAALAAGALPPAGEREVPRTSIEQPFDPRDYVSPLSGFRRYWQEPRADQVLLTVEGLPAGARLRLATLDSYDGLVYSVGSDLVDSASGAFTRVPYQLDQSAIPGTPVSIRVAVAGYRGIWLPTIGQLERFGFDGSAAAALRNSFYYNDMTGSAVVLSGLSEGDGYTLEGVLPRQPAASELARLDAGATSLPPFATLPEELSLVLDDYTIGVEGQGNRLVAMLRGLARDGYISHGVGEAEPASRSGHSADRISQLLTNQRMIGDAEQYAVTAALMARELGFPARVVLGFAPGGTAGTGAVEIHGRDISAWIEVDTAQYGWVSIDPTPKAREIPPEQPQDPKSIARPQSVVPPGALDPSTVDRQNTSDTQQKEAEAPNPLAEIIIAALIGIGWFSAIALICLAPFLLILAAKAGRRRRRRRAATSLGRIRGGWSEFEDRVIDHGFTPSPAATRSEVAAVVGGPQPIVLAAVADRAVFAPSEPDSEEADRVWRSVRELTVALGADLTRWQRLRARVSLRSLLRRL